MKNIISKEDMIILITERIKSEHKKHKNIEWERIAAHKIYATIEENELKRRENKKI